MISTIRHLSQTAATAYLAGPTDDVKKWIDNWGTWLQILGAAIIGACFVLIGITTSGKSATARDGHQSGVREGLGKAFGVIIGAVFVGAGLIIAPWFIAIGKAA